MTKFEVLIKRGADWIAAPITPRPLHACRRLVERAGLPAGAYRLRAVNPEPEELFLPLARELQAVYMANAKNPRHVAFPEPKPGDWRKPGIRLDRSPKRYKPFS